MEEDIKRKKMLKDSENKNTDTTAQQLDPNSDGSLTIGYNNINILDTKY
jgi:hypothetical protein